MGCGGEDERDLLSKVDDELQLLEVSVSCPHDSAISEDASS
jgi:hypothetical protein